MALVSVRAYAKHRDVSHTAVFKAIRAGKITRAVKGEGKDLRIDSEIADREWQPDRAPKHPLIEIAKTIPPKKIKILEPPKVVAEEPETPEEKDDEEVPEEKDIDPIADGRAKAIGGYYQSRASKEEINAKLLQMKYDQEMGILVEADEIKKAWVNLASQARTKILAVPSKMKQRVTDFPHSHYIVLEEIIREALEDLANSKGI